ncbi:MAG: hypothetical protein A2Z18_10555 [Armatimonadetes bacterium RBG_16_58_9]|nr:MAG: hypothetical protein A2Z18_10555 [Armatimonadetes bacterium RBG_16_58_9]
MRGMVDGRLAVIGAGTMGAGIAQVAASAGTHVILVDIDEELAMRGLERITRNLESFVSKEKISAEDKEAVLARIACSADLEGTGRRAGFVIEAAVEDVEVKRSIFRRLGEVCAPDVVLATNTSSLSVTEIAARVRNPERVIGLHFFNPAPAGWAESPA